MMSDTFLKKTKRIKDLKKKSTIHAVYHMIPYRYMYATTAVHVLTINLQVIVSVLFSSSVDSHTGVPACVANLCAIQGQHSATSKHLTGRRKQSRGHVTVLGSRTDSQHTVVKRSAEDFYYYLTQSFRTPAMFNIT